ncbi:efflux RND transporter periplasmic adaptor subunit [Ewingella americana]|uniref:Cobalt/zinc/cadmium efflux RND transporter membrane fusion protein n=2 Tax=Ewingella americana TaxID=41202 RepID=A0A085GJX1_EWIA3|nr:efflux RND transporter periplasmic adaptor subunit [Ewingella americana]KFC84016.1 cobalt/zinc/cadmium efflux RND transporter membrane fusion protein [Ewingella americana ATCC 33852]
MMKIKSFKLAALALLCIAAGGASGYWLAKSQAPAAQQAPAKTATAAEPKALYWYDPMAPAQHFDKPGKSPFMDMQLVPKYADAADSTTADSGVKIDGGMVQNLAIRLAPVVQGPITSSIRAVANVVLNDREVAIVQARSNGFVQRSYPLAAGDVVAAGAPLVDLLMPDWAGAQAEYLALLHGGDSTLRAAARQRLVLLGMPASLINQVTRSGKAQPVYTLTAPIGGVIQSLDIRQGMTVANGSTLLQLNGISSVWLQVAVPEAQASQVQNGQTAQISFPAYPGKTFSGKVSAILPVAEAASRTLNVRIEVANPQQLIRPGMFAQVSLQSSSAADSLSVPSEAIIRTGLRNVVIVSEANHHFAPVEVQLGAESAGRTQVLSGLQAGQQVVASGQFLIDSEASLQGVLDKMDTAQSGGTQP